MNESEDKDEKDILILRCNKHLQDLQADLKNERKNNEELNLFVQDLERELKEKDDEAEQLKMDKYLLQSKFPLTNSHPPQRRIKRSN